MEISDVRKIISDGALNLKNKRWAETGDIAGTHYSVCVVSYNHQVV